MVAGDAGDFGIVDVFDWVGTVWGRGEYVLGGVEWVGGLPASVLGQGGVVVVDQAGFGAEDDILEDGAEFDGVENVGFLFGGKADAFGIALV